MAALPQEIIVEILSRLPVNSLLRFKRVCKSWYSLIKTPQFIKLHLNRALISNSDRHLVFCCLYLYSAELNSNHNQLYFSKHDHILDPLLVRISGSCNGIICIMGNCNSISLYNPLTKSRFDLPISETPELEPLVTSLGFGYDSKNDDYKVLRIVQGFNNSKIYDQEVKLFSYNKNSWKWVEVASSYNFRLCRHGVLVDEALHYLVINKESSSKNLSIAKFDLFTEKFSVMNFPEGIDMARSNVMLTLTNLGGSLSLMAKHHSLSAMGHADLWVMKTYGNKGSWCKLYSIRNCIQAKPMVYSEDGRRILLELDNRRYGWYDLESKIVDKFTSYGLSDRIYLRTKILVGSLVLLQDKLHSDSDKENLPR
ncbi:F-box protein CPR1 [Bienertia sinuspersici]